MRLYVTTFCSLNEHRVLELAKGRSEISLHSALIHMKGWERVQEVCMDLSFGQPAAAQLIERLRLTSFKLFQNQLKTTFFSKEKIAGCGVSRKAMDH